MNCICCKKPMEVCKIFAGDNNQTDIHPFCAIDGGSWLEIDPGFGSKFDHLERAGWFAIICDDCIEKNKKYISKYIQKTRIIKDGNDQNARTVWEKLRN